MTWQRVAALGLLVPALSQPPPSHNEVIAATLVGAAAGFAANRDLARSSSASPNQASGR